jgi:hypothetical protein
LLAIQPNKNSIAPVASTQGASVRRYETIIATLVGVSALFVSGYTAYVQRQQVRAAVWPILEYSTSNIPDIRFTVDNKGVGPAIVRHVVVNLDGQPIHQWFDSLEKILGPGPHRFSQSTINGHVLSAGESMIVFSPHDDNNQPLTMEKGGPIWTTMNKDRDRFTVEICYCSTLGECWILRSGPKGNTTTETSTCPDRSAITFQQ